jgi:hypothetical protein
VYTTDANFTLPTFLEWFKECDAYTLFVQSAVVYLRSLRAKSPLRIGIVVSTRHILKNEDARGNYITLAHCIFDDTLALCENANNIKKCISHAKKTGGGLCARMP